MNLSLTATIALGDVINHAVRRRQACVSNPQRPTSYLKYINNYSVTAPGQAGHRRGAELSPAAGNYVVS
jgi:hypothetical protein